MIVNKSNSSLKQINPSELWSSLEDFASYAFNKSHAVAYSIIAYKTAAIWKYHKNEYLEYLLNYSAKGYNDAIEECRREGKKFVFPDIHNMMGDKYIVTPTSIQYPGMAARNYDSYVDFLFDTENKGISQLILKGVCDELCKDREGLLDLISYIPAKMLSQAKYMDNSLKTIEDIVKELSLIDGITYTKDNSTGTITVTIHPIRGKDRIVNIDTKITSKVLDNITKYDMKYFGAVRSGILDYFPNIKTDSVMKKMEEVKTRMKNRGFSDYDIKDRIKYIIWDHIDSVPANKKKYENVKCILTDYKIYPNRTIITLTFADKTDFFYLRGDASKVIQSLNKKDLISCTMTYAPYSNRNMEFVYDFDISDIKRIG